jgi:hypothetical protein
MKPTLLFLLLILCGAAMAHAETYKWINKQGVISFTDDPAKIPSRYRDKALRGDSINQSLKVHQDLGKQEKKKRLKNLKPPRTVTSPVSGQPAPASQEMLQSFKGHSSGDQINPAPPSMKQPVPGPLGEQPTPTPLGMKQPIPAPLGDQPTATPLGMKQPTPAPLGDQPKPTPAGMEQPTPAR